MPDPNHHQEQKRIERPRKVLIFANGLVAVFDEKGEQIADLQFFNVFRAFCDFATRKGFDVQGMTIECGHIIGTVNGHHGDGSLKIDMRVNQ